MTQMIRVVVANRPRLMRELVIEAISNQPDIDILAEIQHEDGIIGAVAEILPDVLIIALDEVNQRPPLCDILLRRFPDMKILALAPERNCSFVYWSSFDIHESFVEVSEAGILSTLRRENQAIGG